METDVIGHDIVANIEDVVEKTDKIIEDNIAVYNYNTEATDEDSIIKCFIERNMFVKDIQKRFPKYKIDDIVNILINRGIKVKDSDIGK